MNVEVRSVPREQAHVVKNLMQLYLYEASDLEGAGEFLEEMGADGRYEPFEFDTYWEQPGRYPFLIWADGKLAGFALIAERSEQDRHAVTEFFVLRVLRRRRIGESAARFLFDHYPGEWEVSELTVNEPAREFWRAVIGRYAGGAYTEENGPKIVVQRFRNG